MHFTTLYLALATTAQLVLAVPVPTIRVDIANPRLDNLYMMHLEGSDNEPEVTQ